MNTSALIRPAWTPATIALMVIGFAVFWPLGFAMLAYIIWGDRLEGFKRDVNRATDGMFRGCRAPPAIGPSAAPAMWHSTTGARRSWSGWPKSGASSTRCSKQFDEYARELSRAKDQEEFDRFMASRSGSAPTATPNGKGRGAAGGLLDEPGRAARPASNRNEKAALRFPATPFFWVKKLRPAWLAPSAYSRYRHDHDVTRMPLDLSAPQCRSARRVWRSGCTSWRDVRCRCASSRTTGRAG